jgi:hypothetical protein
MLSQLDVWISGADDWKKNDKDSKGDSDGDDNDDPKGYRKKRSYKKVRFPVKRVKNYRKFPISKFHISFLFDQKIVYAFFFSIGRFPPLISIFPWVPIFYDKLTYQTIIFSPTGGREYFNSMKMECIISAFSLHYPTTDQFLWSTFCCCSTYQMGICFIG